MGIIYWVLMGLVAGVLGKFLLPGKDPSGWIVTIVLGVLGAVVGGWVGTRLGFGTVEGFDLRSLILAVVGTMIVLAGLRFLRK